MIIVTTDNIYGKEIKEVKGFVSGGTIQSKNIIKDIGSGFKTIIGGELNAYNEMMDDARRIAIDRMCKQAEEIGANAIVCVRLTSSTIVGGAAEILAYGTAVVVE